MCRDLENAYVSSCIDCQHNKSSTKKPIGPLYPLPVPENRGSSVAINFIGPLLEDEGFDYIMTFTDRLGADIQIVSCKTTLTPEDTAQLFFINWYCENGLPNDIILD
jgi:hypothetical protein